MWFATAIVVQGQVDGTKQPGSTITVVDALGDSLVRSYSVDELINYKKYYEEERSRLEQERSAFRAKGIQDLEAFVRSHPESNVLDKVIFRLAELNFEAAQNDYLIAQEEYGNQLEQYDAGQLSTVPTEPKKDYSRSVNLYQSIIDDFPQSALQDDAYYNIGFLNEDLGNKDEAVLFYEKFLEEFEDSEYVPDVLMRYAEYYFNPPVNQIERAIEIYKQVLNFEHDPKYDEALYRLGWSYYKLNDFPNAISYFTYLADDIEHSAKYDPENRVTNPSLKEESIEYIGISFLDYNGVEGAERYLKEIGGRTYGIKILKTIGDAYMDVKEEYESAIDAYEALLKLYPFSAEAPVVQAKIAEAYRFLENDEQTYLMRKKLFSLYNENSEWWEKVTDEDARRKAAQFCEHAMRSNVNMLLDLANEDNNLNLYEQAVNDTREYLAIFPEDTNAVKMHWNVALTLDSKLNRSADAFAEFIAISNIYWDSPYQKEAARNAIAISQDFIREPDSTQQIGNRDSLSAAVPQATNITDSTQLDEPAPQRAKSLSDGELKLVEAIDNFLKLYPLEQETPQRLSQAGSIYYNKGDYVNSLRYFKTLLKHFSDDSLAANAHYLVMESYFGKGDFPSVEVIAKRIKGGGFSADSAYAGRASKRLAEAIFLQAQQLAEKKEYFKAAEEYTRVADEVPDAAFADLALFNAGVQYDQAKEFSRAVEIYERLTTNYTSSSYYHHSLNNMALDYGELKDFRNAAIVFERLADEEIDSTKIETHLYNSSVYYVKAEDWKRAIRVNRKFVKRYPESNDADDLFYDIANYYLKLNDFEKANGIYGEFAEKFPDSPRVIESFYWRGEYYEKQGNVDLARVEYRSAIDKSDAFISQQKDGNPYFAAEALFKLTEIKYKEFDSLAFKLPVDALKRNKEKKKTLLLDIVESYTKVVGYGTIRLYESTFKIGLAYEEFAETWAKQEIQAGSEDQRVVAQKEINETGSSLFERAVDSYKNSFQVLADMAQKYKDSLQEAPVDTIAKSPENQKITFADSTLLVAERWISRSRDKISENIYDIAEINSSSIQALLNVPLPDGLDKLTELEFKNQLLEKFISPLADNIVDAHIRNLKESSELGIDNNWVEESRNKIVTTNKIVAGEFAGLSWKSLKGFEERIDQYVNMIDQDENAALGIGDEMANFVDFSKSFSKITIDAYKKTIVKAQQHSIQNNELASAEFEFMEFINDFSIAADSLSRVSNNRKMHFTEKFNSNDEPKYEDAVFTFDDNFLALGEARKELLATGYQIAQELEIDNDYSQQIVQNLVKSDPEKYAGLLGLELKDFQIVSDSTWVGSAEKYNGFMMMKFDQSVLHTPDFIVESATFPSYKAQNLWFGKGENRIPGAGFQDEAGNGNLDVKDTTGLAETKLSTQQDSAHSSIVGIADSTAGELKRINLDSTASQVAGITDSLTSASAAQDSIMPDATPRLERAETSYIRKIFEIDGLFVSGQIQIHADDSYDLFLNGELISETPANPAGLKTNVHDLTNFIRTGRNIIALKVKDTDSSGGGIEALLFLKHVPGWDERQKELIGKRTRERENLLFDKGIIIKH